MLFEGSVCVNFIYMSRTILPSMAVSLSAYILGKSREMVTARAIEEPFKLVGASAAECQNRRHAGDPQRHALLWLIYHNVVMTTET